MIKQNYKNLIFSIQKSILLIKKIIKKNGKIIIIYLNPNIIYLFKSLNLHNFFYFVQWTPGLFTNNCQKKPDLIIIFDQGITCDKIKEIYKIKVPLIFFYNFLKVQKTHILYPIKYKINIKNIYLFLILLQKFILINSYGKSKIKKKKIR